jgi:hypothetical protein
VNPSEATVLWIEAGAMSGGSRNQVEFAQDLAEFFAPAIEAQRWLTLTAGSRSWSDRTLSPKRTTFGVDIWRLSLPTQAQSGMRYPDRIIRFERVQGPGGREAFRIAVADVGSNQHERWRHEALERGEVGTTSGDREYGIY